MSLFLIFGRLEVLVEETKEIRCLKGHTKLTGGRLKTRLSELEQAIS